MKLPRLRRMGWVTLAVTATVVVAAGARYLGPPAWAQQPLASARSHPVPSAPQAESGLAERVANAITELELTAAERMLKGPEADMPPLAVERLRLALYRGDCDTALALSTSLPLQASPEGASLAEVARGCAQATAAAEIVEDPSRGIWIRLADSEDKALAPFIQDVVEKARHSLLAELGVSLPRPTRIELVRDLFSLAALSGLPVTAAETTGTVGVARFGRVILVSPRATPLGYPWEDTLAHEMTHLALGRASRERAPLWLQEGLAKLTETRWRAPRPFDETGAHVAIARSAILAGRGIDIDQLGPSIALLPTPDQATAAYAEVTSFVDYWIRKNGKPALKLLLLDLRGIGERDAGAALRSVTGYDFAFWQADWRRSLLSGKASGEGTPGVQSVSNPPVDAKTGYEVYRSVRLGDLLFQRGHYAAARLKLATAWNLLPHEASIRWRVARAELGAGTRSSAIEHLGNLSDIGGPNAGWYALSGYFSAEARDRQQAERWFSLAIASDPLSVDVACEGRWREPKGTVQSTISVFPGDPARRALCVGALRIPRD